MPPLEPNIVKKVKALRGIFAFSFGSFYLLLWLGILLQPLGAAPLELPGKGETPLEEVVGAVNKPDTRDLLLLQRALPPLDALDSLERVTHRARPGDTLAKLFRRFGLSKEEGRSWLRSIQAQHPMKGLQAGREIYFYFTKARTGKTAGKRLKALEVELNEDWILTWEKGDKGIVFSKREKPYDVELKTVGGVVESSLFEDGVRVGLNTSLLSQLADIFTWDVDFDKEIKKGDTFKLLYEERSRKGKENKTSFRILAAELINAGQNYFALYFEKERGKGNYYDLDGRSLARAFLRFPLEFSSISSHFSHSRFHPILKVDRPHNGVDFSAKRGTPVRAVGDGKILHAGWRQGGYGKMIELQHDPVYASHYAHLQGFAQGMRKGVNVKKGQIIGYVGSSGRSTGAHLHFEFYKGQQYVDPLNVEFPPEDRIEPAFYRLFERAKQLVLAELAAIPHS